MFNRYSNLLITAEAEGTTMYARIWKALEIWHGMRNGNERESRLFILKHLKAGNKEAHRAAVEFADACFIANIPFDLDYDLD